MQLPMIHTPTLLQSIQHSLQRLLKEVQDIDRQPFVMEFGT